MAYMNGKEILSTVGGTGGGANIPLEKGTGENAVQQVGSEASGDYAFARGASYMLSDVVGEKEVANKATGRGATAEGCGTLSTGEGAHAEGTDGKITKEENEYRPTEASGRGAHAEGCGTVSSGKGSHSEGYAAEATDEGAHAEGKRAKATNVAAHAEGSETEAQGYAAHAEGIKGKAIGDHSHVEGADGEASGKNSHVEGWGCSTTAEAGASHAGGEASKAHAYAAFAHGVYTEAKELGQFVIGKANEDNPNAIFIIGNGFIDSDTYEPITRRNVFEIIPKHTPNGSHILKLGETEITEEQLSTLLPKKCTVTVGFFLGTHTTSYCENNETGDMYSAISNQDCDEDGKTVTFTITEGQTLTFWTTSAEIGLYLDDYTPADTIITDDNKFIYTVTNDIGLIFDAC